MSRKLFKTYVSLYLSFSYHIYCESCSLGGKHLLENYQLFHYILKRIIALKDCDINIIRIYFILYQVSLRYF